VEVADGLQQLLHRLYHVAVDDGPLGEQLHTREAVEVDDSRLFVWLNFWFINIILVIFIDYKKYTYWKLT
jgi:hypothetical protein